MEPRGADFLGEELWLFPRGEVAAESPSDEIPAEQSTRDSPWRGTSAPDSLDDRIGPRSRSGGTALGAETGRSATEVRQEGEPQCGGDEERGG